MYKTGSTIDVCSLFVGGELFAAGFVSCGHNLVRLVRSLEMTLSSPNIPP
uniref:Uncharacterized protein n=1 Tax=Solanum lycopersicum TaxID=4081 RepID=A0A3Q7G6W3_SOLLC